MNLKEYKGNFSPLEVPDELVKLLKFSNKLDDFFSESFELEDNDKGGLSTWSDKPAFLECLYPIGQADGTGSTYAIWRQKGRLSDAPVVIFGSEGGVHVVGENLANLLRILSLDSEPMVDHESVTYYKGKDREPSTGAEAYAKWLAKELNLTPVSGMEEVADIVARAEKTHGDAFRKWLRQFVAQ